MSSKNITDTSSRLKENLMSLSQEVYDNQNVSQQIDDAILDSMICTGVMTKFYPSLNKCEVKLDTTGEKVLCKVSLLFMGDLLLLYTPSGDADYCEKLHEPCVIPRGNLGCIVAQLNSNDDDYLFLSYYAQDEFIGLNPSKQGNMKILAMNGVTESSLKYGIDGLSIVSNGEIDKTAIDGWGQEISPTEYYSKEEIDELFDEFRKEGIAPYLDNIYPVGSIYISMNENDPSTFFGGEWERLKDRFLLGSGDIYELLDNDGNNNTGGEAEHTLTIDEMPKHTHTPINPIWNAGSTVSSKSNEVVWDAHGNSQINTLNDTGGDQPHNNLPPYVVVCMWKRVK